MKNKKQTFGKILQGAINKMSIVRFLRWVTRPSGTNICSACRKNKAELVVKGNLLCYKCLRLENG